MRNAIDRRHFLKTASLKAAAVSLALPWLESSARGFAAEAEPPDRVVFICTALGLHAPALFPNATGSDYESTEYLDLLKEHRKDFTLFSGLSHPDQGGEHATLLTWLSAARNPGLDGFRNSISVDQFAAGQLGYVTRFPSLRLSSNGPMSQSFTSSGVMVPAESSPSTLFSKMFLEGKPHEIAAEKRRLREGRSILDQLMRQTKSLSATVSASDKRRLDEYFESLRSTERDLLAAAAWIDKPKPKTESRAPVDIADTSEFIGRVRLLLNLVPLIVQSDSSRVVSVVIQDHYVVPKVDGVSSEHHNLSHHGKDPEKIAQLKRIEKEIVSCVSGFLKQMKSKTEAGRSLLDKTMTLFGSNLGNANAHDPRNLPILLAGGDFKHGKHVAYDQSRNVPLCNLFLCMLNRMKIESDSFATSSGELTW